ncbi:MAG: alpha/beta hydrolase, partial [Flavobacterium stagni]
QEAPLGFAKNDQYTTLDLTENIKQLVEKKMPVYGFYGQEDGLYSEAQIKKLEQLLPEKQLYYWSQCSHSVFIDQQSNFIATLKAIL